MRPKKNAKCDSAPDHHRQILAMLGNRTVVFGDQQASETPLQFTPETDSVLLPRVGNEREISEQRILETLKVAGFTLEQKASDKSDVDLVMTTSSGETVFVELKVGDGAPSHRELTFFEEELKRFSAFKGSSEVWRFSREELQLDLYTLVDGKMTHETLLPLNVWEATDEGIFERSTVVKRVADWEQRLRDLYAEISKWTADWESVNTEQTRTVIMSEALMRAFAVPDMDLPILDVSQNGEPIASLVPRALWIVGADGRIDVITRTGTRILVDIGEERWGWRVIDSEDRRKLVTLNQAVMATLMGVA